MMYYVDTNIIRQTVARVELTNARRTTRLLRENGIWAQTRC